MTATATAPAFTVGQRIIVDPNGIGVSPSVLGRVFIVKRVNPKNVVCSPADGIGRGINYPKYLLLPAPEDDDAQGPAVLVPYVPPVFHDVGAIVTCEETLTYRGMTWPAGSPLIVWKCDGRKSNVVNLGGNPTGGYFRIPVARLTVRDAAWLAEYLVSTL